MTETSKEQDRGVDSTGRAAAWLAWSLVALSGALLAGGSALSLTTRSTVPGLSNGGTVDAIFTLAPMLTFSVVGAIVSSRHPRNTIGWIFCGIGLVVGLSSLTGGYAEYWLENKIGSKSLAETAAWFSSWAWILLVFIPTSFMLLFPRPSKPSRRSSGTRQT